MKAPCAALARRALLAAAIGCTMDRRSAIAMVPQPEITSRARLAITIGDAPAQFVTLGLYGTAAPASVKTFESLCTGTLDWAPGLSYSGSAVSQIVKDRYITAGKLSGGDAKGIERSIDRTGYVRSVMVDRAAQLANTDANALSHDRAGLLSVPKGGGAFEFMLTPTSNAQLDGSRIVIGEVVDGMGVLTSLNTLAVNVPSTQRDLLGLAALYGLKAGVGLGVVGIVGRTGVANNAATISLRVGAGAGAAALVGGDDPRVRSREVAYRPLKRVRILNAEVLT